MRKKTKIFLKSVTPPFFVNLLRKKTNKYGFFGNYKTWKEATANSSGYDNPEILEKVKNALLKVKNGEAAYERDSVLFDKIEYSWPLLASLLWVASQNNNTVNVIDFGGSLGSSYYQNKKFLDQIENLKWNVVEQAKFVDCGKKLFQNNNLSFFYSMEESQSKSKSDTLLALGVIQYLEDPYVFLQNVINLKFKYIIFDRTMFLKNADIDRITVQKVPPEIYDASYPAWFLNEKKFLGMFAEKYNLIEDFISLAGEITLEDNVKAIEKGYIFKIK